jgi:DNA-binding response OmpR family regulator
MKKRVLIIDDDDLMAETLRKRLVMEQYETLYVNNAYDALNLLTKKYNFDLLIIDLMLPRISGLKLLKILNIHYPPMAPIIFISSLNNAEIILNTIEKGAKDFFIKPINYDELVDRIKILI